MSIANELPIRNCKVEICIGINICIQPNVCNDINYSRK